MPDINLSYQWMINLCNAANTGYSQSYRRGQTVNGITYYDCSSSISAALSAGGFFATNPWFTTSTMRTFLQQTGFQSVNIGTRWLPGDIVWRSGHCEMVYQSGEDTGGGVTMGAHSSDRPLDEQISINNYVSTPDMYTELWRYGGGATGLTWISGNYYLDNTQMQNNAYVQYSDLYAKGWTRNAIAGLLGNEQVESTINPGVWQNLDEGNYNIGFGLVQWTPATNFTDWATAQGYNITDGNAQDIWLDTMSNTSGQWIPTTDYPMSFEEYKVSTEPPDYLASVWLHNFERAGVEREQDRRDYANTWYDYLGGLTPIPQPSNPIPGWNTSLYIQYGAIAESIRKRRKYK